MTGGVALSADRWFATATTDDAITDARRLPFNTRRFTATGTTAMTPGTAATVSMAIPMETITMAETDSMEVDAGRCQP
jgi:hypothetical protein